MVRKEFACLVDLNGCGRIFPPRSKNARFIGAYLGGKGDTLGRGVGVMDLEIVVVRRWRRSLHRQQAGHGQIGGEHLKLQ